MSSHYAYPPQLARFVRHSWEATRAAPLPMDQTQLEHLLSVAYQASLLRDEDRTVHMRIVAARPEEFDSQQGPPSGLQPLVFNQAVPYTPDELRRLSIAAKYHRALVGVSPLIGDAGHGIWGMLQSGPGWIQVAQGGRGPAPAPPPSALLVRVLGPGRIAVGCGLSTLAELRGGVVGGPGMDLFRSEWLLARFSAVRAELARLHAEARAQAEAAGERWADLDPDVIGLVSQAMVRRFLAAMVSAHHGGTVILLPQESAEEAVRGAGPLRLKYAFRDEEPRRRYRRLILGLMRAVARAGGSEGVASVDGDTYASLRDDELASMRDAIFEMSQLIAALSEVDGAVVMTKRFELLGFGAEIVGDLPQVEHVARALDLEAEDSVAEPLVADGTRHRSAYRLCSRVPDALALVVSQDGGVRFVAAHRGEVTFWDHAVETLDG
jgi:hypothetical protein